ncbi:hypothetical protein CCMA1212_003207 [Trichoderma ghanense]|uniref:Secreted protein n=1 Tax=Trichoderma ghanense TaxID=65468 RepID=A0ABY2H9I6_9HYPO
MLLILKAVRIVALELFLVLELRVVVAIVAVLLVCMRIGHIGILPCLSPNLRVWPFVVAVNIADARVGRLAPALSARHAPHSAPRQCRLGRFQRPSDRLLRLTKDVGPSDSSLADPRRRLRLLAFQRCRGAREVVVSAWGIQDVAEGTGWLRFSLSLSMGRSLQLGRNLLGLVALLNDLARLLTWQRGSYVDINLGIAVVDQIIDARNLHQISIELLQFDGLLHADECWNVGLVASSPFGDPLADNLKLLGRQRLECIVCRMRDVVSISQQLQIDKVIEICALFPKPAKQLLQVGLVGHDHKQIGHEPHVLLGKDMVAAWALGIAFPHIHHHGLGEHVLSKDRKSGLRGHLVAHLRPVALVKQDLGVACNDPVLPVRLVLLLELHKRGDNVFFPVFGL